MTFDEWWDDLKVWPQTKDEIRQVWDAAISAGLKDAAARFEGTLAFNWVCADGYSNGLDIGGELRSMSQERANAGLAVRLQGKMNMECNCNLRTKLVGDGCEDCNPELAAQFELVLPPMPG